jgi:alkylhydroperoxidase/carboxymuconolactone decarboxylase family protein YurZ
LGAIEVNEEYTGSQIAAKEQFCQERGAWKWNDTWETILSLNEDILSAYSALSSVPHKRGYLSPKLIGMVYVAIDSAITHLYIPGMKSHMKHGLRDLGITKEEFMEVLAITTTIGAGTFTQCYAMFTKALRDSGINFEKKVFSAKDNELKSRCEKQFGSWDENMMDILSLNPEILEAYLNYVEASESKNALDAKTREFIYIAVNASPTTLNKDNVYKHTMKAIKLGATKEELSELFELVACLGIHTITVGIPVLNEALG